MLAVLLFHGGYLRGGYLGVDAFFVLSGFLITSLLLIEHEHRGRVDRWRFYARRARRLLPAAWAMLFAVAAYGAFVAPAPQRHGLWSEGMATLLYVANWQSIFAAASYWDLFGAPSPLAHTWSLAIEEQFYLLWPLLVGALLRWRSRRTLMLFCLAGAIGAWVAMALLFAPGDTSRAYYGTDTRAGALLVGAALACAPNRLRAHIARFALPGAVVTLTAMTLLSGHDAVLYRGGFVVTQLAVVAVLAGAASPSTPLTRALSWPALRRLGDISYGLYLWHWPIFTFLSPVRLGLAPLPTLAVRLTVSLLVAVVSYRWLERPLREGALRPRVARFAAVTTPIAVAGVLWVGTRVSARPAVPPDRSWADDVPAGAKPFTLVVFGDSLAERLVPAMSLAADELHVSVVGAGQAGCGLLHAKRHRLPEGRLRRSDPGCPDPVQRARTVMAEHPAERALLMLGAPSMGEFELDERFVHPCQKAFDHSYQRQAEAVLTALQSTGATAYVATMVPVRQEDYGPEQDRRTRCLNTALTRAAGASGARVLPLADFVCPDDICRTHVDGALLRPDGLHFDHHGADRISFWLVPQLRP